MNNENYRNVWYGKIPDEEYFSIPAISNSGISVMLDYCPEKFYYYISGGNQPDSAVYNTGKIIHAYHLEQDTFFDKYTPKIYGGNSKLSKEETIEIEATDKIPIKGSDFEIAQAIDRKIRADPIISKLYKWPEQMSEVVITWEEKVKNPVNGEDFWVPCKAKLDKVIHGGEGIGSIIIDLKSIKDARKHYIEKTISEYAYFRQEGIYRHAATIAGWDVKSFLFIFVEKDPPYIVSAAYISDDDNTEWRPYWERAKEIYAECTTTGIWPNYNNGKLMEINIRNWRKDYEPTGFSGGTDSTTAELE